MSFTTRHLLKYLLKGGGNSSVPVSIGGTGIHNNSSRIDHIIWKIQKRDTCERIGARRRCRFSILAGTQGNSSHPHVPKSATSAGKRRIDHFAFVQSGIRAAQSHGTRFGALALGRWLTSKAKSKLLLVSHFPRPVHLTPKRFLFGIHTHDSVRQLGFEQAGDHGLTTKGQFKGQAAGVVRVNALSVVIIDQGRFVRTSNVASVSSFKGSPTASFCIGHGNGTLVHGAMSSFGQTPVRTSVGFKRRRFIVFKKSVDVIRWDTTVLASFARKGSDTASSIYNDCLSLGWTSTPQINIVRSVSLIQSSDFERLVTATDARLFGC